MDSVYYAFGGLAVVVIIYWAMMADRRSGPYAGLLAMRRPDPNDPRFHKSTKSKRGAGRK